MKKASWVILAIVGALVVLGGLVSVGLAYGGNDYPIGDMSVSKVVAGHEGLEPALRGIRGTSGAYAAAYGILFLAIVLGPYRRGEVWAWWALLAALAALAVLTALRVPTLGVARGLGGAFIQFGVATSGLLLDVSRLRATR